MDEFLEKEFFMQSEAEDEEIDLPAEDDEDTEDDETDLPVDDEEEI